MFTDLSGRFKYDQLTPVVSNESYVQEFGPSLQLGKFEFQQVTPGAVVAGDSLQQWEFSSFGIKRLYQITPSGVSPLPPRRKGGSNRAVDELTRYERELNAKELFDIFALVLLSGVFDDDF